MGVRIPPSGPFIEGILMIKILSTIILLIFILKIMTYTLILKILLL